MVKTDKKKKQNQRKSRVFENQKKQQKKEQLKNQVLKAKKSEKSKNKIKKQALNFEDFEKALPQVKPQKLKNVNATQNQKKMKQTEFLHTLENPLFQANPFQFIKNSLDQK